MGEAMQTYAIGLRVRSMRSPMRCQANMHIQEYVAHPVNVSDTCQLVFYLVPAPPGIEFRISLMVQLGSSTLMSDGGA